MIHLGDITKIHGDEIEPVDCITFGSPCQDLSIAGRRAGLAGERSGLFMEAVRIIKEMRSSTNGLCPTFAIWENVPGAFSSSNGEDFRAVLEELARIGQPNAVIPRPPRGGRWSKAGAIAGNGWSLAWRQLDSQYFGVAQRRKRIALILDLGGQRAGEILFERTSLSRHPDPCIPAWKEVTGLTANRPAGNDRVVGAGCCCKSGRDAGCGRTETDRAGKSEAAERTSSDKCCEAAAYTLKIRSGCAGGGKGALVQTEKTGMLSTLQDQTLFQLIQEPTYCISGNMVDRATKQNGMGVGENISFTMDTVNRHAVAYGIQEERPEQPVILESNQVHATVSQTGICPTLPASMGLGGGYVPMVTDHPADKPIVFENHAQDARYKEASTCSPTGCDRWGTGGGNTPLVAVPGQVTSYGIGNGQANAYASKEKSGTLDTMYDAQAVAIEYSGCLNPWDTQARRVYGEDGAFPALPSRETAGGNQQAVLAGQRTRWIVRRLTPTECERLQGYPDGWTDIGEWTDTKGKKHKPADSPRYKALGNSIALPQWFWIAQKMKSYMGDGAKLGSLFDGIGGFPLVWETTYGIGTARWASEIEEFPIAVTKKHFPERKEYEN
jgi:DNA (cytosine-5)-methyltransferase 1